MVFGVKREILNVHLLFVIPNMVINLSVIYWVINHLNVSLPLSVDNKM